MDINNKLLKKIASEVEKEWHIGGLSDTIYYDYAYEIICRYLNFVRRKNIMYKKYIVIQFDQYYPLGGLSDISDSFDTIKEAEEYIKSNETDDINQIIDRDTWKIIKEF